MIEQEKGLLYLVELNNSSFEQNPGKMHLPKGKYVVEIREGVFSYKFGHAADVEVTYQNDKGKKRLKFPDFGRFSTEDGAKDVYQGMSVEFEHDGGEVEIYNPRSAKQFFGKTEGGCTVGIWDGKMFGSPTGQFESQIYKPISTNNVLILANNPDSSPYKSQLPDNLNVTWQSDLTDLGKYNIVVLPPESYSFLYKIRDKNCIDDYVKSGGRIYITGSALQYLNYYNNLPSDIPSYIGNGQYNSVATLAGDMIVGDNNYIKFSTSLTVPVISSDDDNQLAHLHSTDENIGKNLCTMKRIEHNKGKVVWSSFFLMNYENTQNWNKLVLDQIDWLLK